MTNGENIRKIGMSLFPRSLESSYISKGMIKRKTNQRSFTLFSIRNSQHVIRKLKMSIEDLKNRFKKFAIDVALLIQKLPKTTINYAYCNQLVRCSSSPGANYRAASRAKSTRDFINKLKIVEEELDESIFFLELLQNFNPASNDIFNKNIKEANELLAIIVSSIKTARKGNRSNNLENIQHS